MSSAGVSARAPSAPLASYLASDPKLITAPRSNWSADLVLLVALLGLTALLGRPFSKVGVGEFDIYITEPLLLLTGFFALRRCGFRGALERLRRVIPLWPLLLLWLAGAIATARGLYLFGFKMVTYDVGLVEYSIMLALVPVVIDTRQRAISLLKVVFWAGLGAGLIYIGQRFVDHESVNNPGYALGIYIAIFVLGVAAWAAHRLQVRWYLYGLALIAMTAMSWLGVRAVWVALFAAIVTVAVLAPRGHRFVTAAVLAAAFVLSNLGSYGLTELQARVNPPPPPPGAVMVGPAADPDFIADDSGSSVLGGETVQGDAAQGKLSREVRRGYYLDLPVLRSLESDKPYTVLFSVKPLDPVPALGRVGDTSGAGWGAQTWRARPEVRWQAFKKVFEPTDSDERLVLSFDEGPARVRFDGIKVIKGIVKEPASDYQSPTPPCSCAATEAVREARREGKGETEEVIDTSLTKPNIISEARGTFDPNVAGPSYNNTEWRFAIWKFELERAAQQPLFGVGFGRPTNFRWRSGLGGLYDARTGAPSAQDVTGPHNSFVNLTFRTGLSGLAPLLVILAIAAHRLWGWLRRRDLETEDRALIAALVAIFVFITVIASLSVALEGPYMGIFFWTALALLLTLPRMLPQAPVHSSYGNHSPSIDPAR